MYWILASLSQAKYSQSLATVYHRHILRLGPCSVCPGDMPSDRCWWGAEQSNRRKLGFLGGQGNGFALSLWHRALFVCGTFWLLFLFDFWAPYLGCGSNATGLESQSVQPWCTKHSARRLCVWVGQSVFFLMSSAGKGDLWGQKHIDAVFELHQQQGISQKYKFGLSMALGLAGHEIQHLRLRTSAHFCTEGCECSCFQHLKAS